jgi:hypothetical protein
MRVTVWRELFVLDLQSCVGGEKKRGTTGQEDTRYAGFGTVRTRVPRKL